MSDYLLTGAVVNAINMPSVSAEDARRLKPSMALAELLGSFAGQVAESGLRAVRIEYEGDASALNTRPITACALKGLLTPMMESVNMVNAPVVARERNIEVAEVKHDRDSEYQTLVRLTVTTERRSITIAGTLFGGNKPRVVDIDGGSVVAYGHYGRPLVAFPSENGEAYDWEDRGMVAAIAAGRALQETGVSAAAVKWPNDLVTAGRKLGGILVDLQGEAPSQMRAVIGIGVNVRMPERASGRIDQAWTDLAMLTDDAPPARNRLAAALVNQLCRALEVFGDQGFTAFREDWRTLDAIAGRDVVLQQHDRRIHGIALGVDQDGALLLSSAGATKRFVSGDISLRVQT